MEVPSTSAKVGSLPTDSPSKRRQSNDSTSSKSDRDEEINLIRKLHSSLRGSGSVHNSEAEDEVDRPHTNRKRKPISATVFAAQRLSSDSNESAEAPPVEMQPSKKELVRPSLPNENEERSQKIKKRSAKAKESEQETSKRDSKQIASPIKGGGERSKPTKKTPKQKPYQSTSYHDLPLAKPFHEDGTEPYSNPATNPSHSPPFMTPDQPRKKGPPPKLNARNSTIGFASSSWFSAGRQDAPSRASLEAFSKSALSLTKPKQESGSPTKERTVMFSNSPTPDKDKNKERKPTKRSTSFSGRQFIEEEEEEEDFGRSKPSESSNKSPTGQLSQSANLVNLVSVGTGSRSNSVDSQDSYRSTLPLKSNYSSDSAEESSSKNDSSGYSTEQSAILKHQFVLVENLLERKFEVVTALCNEVFQKEDDVECAAYTEALINFFEGYGRLLPLLLHLIGQEIDQTSSSAGLFRGDSFAIRFVSLFFRKSGVPYLELILKPTVNQVIDYVLTDGTDVKDLGSSSMSDMSAHALVNAEAKQLQAKERLLSVTESLIDRVMNSVSKCPKPIRILLQFAHSKVTTRFEKADFMTVGGLFFLRFICPAIVSPAKYKIIDETITPETTRFLISVSRLMQGYANMLIGGEESADERSNRMIRGIRTYSIELLVPVTPGGVSTSTPFATKSIGLAEIAARATSTFVSPSPAEYSSFKVSRKTQNDSMLLIKQYIDKYFDSIRITLLMKKTSGYDSIKESNLNHLREALNGLQEMPTSSKPKGFKLFRDKHTELQKQLTQERAARNFYEQVQRQLLEKVNELREVMTDERRKREERRAKRQKERGQMRITEKEIPSNQNDDYSDVSDGEHESEFLRQMQQVDFGFSENQRLRSEAERSRMYAEEVLSRTQEEIIKLTAQFESAKEKILEECGHKLTTQQEEMAHLREDMMRERKAFLRNLKLRDEQDKIRQKLKDDLQTVVEALKKENDHLRSDAEKIISQLQEEQRHEVERLSTDNRRMKHLNDALKKQLQEQLSLTAKLQLQLNQAQQAQQKPPEPTTPLSPQTREVVESADDKQKLYSREGEERLHQFKERRGVSLVDYKKDPLVKLISKRVNPQSLQEIQDNNFGNTPGKPLSPEEQEREWHSSRFQIDEPVANTCDRQPVDISDILNASIAASQQSLEGIDFGDIRHNPLLKLLEDITNEETKDQKKPELSELYSFTKSSPNNKPSNSYSRRNSKKNAQRTYEDREFNLFRTPQDDQRDERYYDDTETEHDTIEPLDDGTDPEEHIFDEDDDYEEEYYDHKPFPAIVRGTIESHNSLSKYDGYKQYETPPREISAPKEVIVINSHSNDVSPNKQSRNSNVSIAQTHDDLSYKKEKSKANKKCSIM